MNFCRRTCYWLCVIIITTLILSCNNPFSPKIVKSKKSENYRVADSPDKVLMNLEDAYNRQDLDLYKKCLSKNFRFVLISSEFSEIGVDLDNDGIKDNWWGYDQEIIYHKNLFSIGSSDDKYPVPYNISLDLQIPPQKVWQKDYENQVDEGFVIPCFFALELSYNDRSNISANGYARFYLKLEDGEWKIARWQDESMI